VYYVDSDNLASLTLLDLSAAFDTTVDHVTAYVVLRYRMVFQRHSAHVICSGSCRS